MALKHYIAKSASTGGNTTITVSSTTYQVFNLQSVASGYELAVVGTRICGGQYGGEVHILTYRSGNIVSDAAYVLDADDVILIDNKEFYEYGDTVAMYATMNGVTVEMFGDYSATA